MLTGVDSSRAYSTVLYDSGVLHAYPAAVTGKVAAALEWSIWRSPFSRTKRPHSRQFEFNRIPQSIAGQASELRAWNVGLGTQLHTSSPQADIQRSGLEFKLSFNHAAKRHSVQIAHSARRRPNANSQGCG